MAIGVLIGYDGSPAASTAIDAGAQLFPGAHAWITHPADTDYEPN